MNGTETRAQRERKALREAKSHGIAKQDALRRLERQAATFRPPAGYELLPRDEIASLMADVRARRVAGGGRMAA